MAEAAVVKPAMPSCLPKGAASFVVKHKPTMSPKLLFECKPKPCSKPIIKPVMLIKPGRIEEMKRQIGETKLKAAQSKAKARPSRSKRLSCGLSLGHVELQLESENDKSNSSSDSMEDVVTDD